ncbi:hypothetical protein CH254_04620 [Rhodococcus sp. 06-412-2C]|nr:hypothetical protein CH254_04620 [Rhodococcus sp. 06-412-2C]OZC92335.1 hypothetical protein CH279_25895 [Rhodococcus sp. 06-412-2B]
MIGELGALAALDLDESDVRQWIMWNTRSVDGTVEDGVSIADTFASIRRHCDDLMAASARAEQ